MSEENGPFAGWRALSKGHGPAVYWGGLALLVFLAAVPFVLFSVTAPSSEVDRPVQLSSSSRSLDGDPPSAPSDPSSPAARPVAAEAGAASPTPRAAVQAPAGRPARSAASSGGADDRADGDFEIGCWPEAAVIPGRSATVDCSVEITNGYDSEISIACRVEGMECAVSPARLQPVPGQDTMPAKLTISAPASAAVGTRLAAVTATGGETGAAQRHADVNVDVPPPFSVSCESVGTSFVVGSQAQVKCWVTFHEGFGDDVSLRLLNGAAVDATLDTTLLSPAPNETRSFVIQVDTAGLANRPYALQVGAASDRYREEATALFQIIPAP